MRQCVMCTTLRDVCSHWSIKAKFVQCYGQVYSDLLSLTITKEKLWVVQPLWRQDANPYISLYLLVGRRIKGLGDRAFRAKRYCPSPSQVAFPLLIIRNKDSCFRIFTVYNESKKVILWNRSVSWWLLDKAQCHEYTKSAQDMRYGRSNHTLAWEKTEQVKWAQSIHSPNQINKVNVHIAHTKRNFCSSITFGNLTT